MKNKKQTNRITYVHLNLYSFKLGRVEICFDNSLVKF